MDTDRTSPSDSPSPRPNIPSTPMTRAAQPVAPSSSSKAALDQEAKIRNAAAQARHRQKRKAHIAQMEQTLVQLQERLRTSSTGDARLRQLEQENDRLHREIQHLRALWSASYGGSDDGQSPPPPSAPQSGAWLPSQGSASAPSSSYSNVAPSHYAAGSGYFPSSASSGPQRYNPVQRPTHHPTSQEQYDPADYNVAASPDFDDFEEDTTASGLQGWTPPEQSQK